MLTYLTWERQKLNVTTLFGALEFFLSDLNSLVTLFLGTAHYHKGKETDEVVISSDFIFFLTGVMG